VSVSTVPAYLNSLMLISLIGPGHELKIFRRIYNPEVHVLVVINVHEACNDSCLNKRNLWTLITYIASHSTNLQRRPSHDSGLTYPRGEPTARCNRATRATNRKNPASQPRGCGIRLWHCFRSLFTKPRISSACCPCSLSAQSTNKFVDTGWREYGELFSNVTSRLEMADRVHTKVSACLATALATIMITFPCHW
jgi:hypothetical protein